LSKIIPQRRKAAEKNIKPKCGKKTCYVKSQEIG